MAQYDFGTIDPNTKSGTALASDLNSWRNAVHSTHSAATAPSYLVAGMLWADTTSANYELKMYDGAQWITVAILDATNNVARVAVDPAETSYITSTTSGQIRHLIASTDVFTVRSTGVQFNIASPVIADSNNNELISFTTTASAVNQIGIANAATGGAATISTVGGDTNINLALTPKGTGGVGVGIASPAGKLHVFASSAGDQFISSSNSAMRLVSTGGANYIQSGTATTSSSAAPLIFTNVGGSGETMRIDASGNLGLGIASPAYKLVVSASGASGIEFGPAYSGAANLIQHYSRSGGVYVDAVTDAAQHRFNTSGTERVRIDASGNMGIGTSSPSYPLHVNGRISYSGAIGEGPDTTLSSASTTVIHAASSTWTAQAFYTGGSERLRIAASGQIGIGGANYGTSGQVLTSGGSGAAPSWASPVFSAQYVSSNQTITSGGLLTLAHSLGAVPKSFTFELECATAEAGFSVGEDIVISINSTAVGDNRFTAVYMDATNVYVRYSNAAQVFTYANKATGAALQLTNTSWRLRVRAFA